MRLNPQVIMVRAAIHSKREEFTSKNPGKFAEIESKVMSRADEPMSQLAYYMFLNNGNKNKVPTILKKSIAKKLSNLSRYEVNKYKNGYYFYFLVEANDSKAVKEFDRVALINENIIRHLVVRVEE
jgi:ribosomal protein S6